MSARVVDALPLLMGANWLALEPELVTPEIRGDLLRILKRARFAAANAKNESLGERIRVWENFCARDVADAEEPEARLASRPT
jgi:hypothetical protein